MSQVAEKLCFWYFNHGNKVYYQYERKQIRGTDLNLVDLACTDGDTAFKSTAKGAQPFV